MDSFSTKDEMEIQQAVDQLTKLADVDIDQLIENPEDSSAHNWISDDGAEKATSNVKSMFGIVHQYLKGVFSADAKKLRDKASQRGIEAIMTIANEAAEKVDQINNFFHSEINQSIKETQEFKNLEEFYRKKIQKRFGKVLEAEDSWVEEFGNENEDILDLNRIGLKDLETVKKDWEYELFYLKKEDGRPFFNRNLLRHIKLVTDFDELLAGGDFEDPFVSTQIIIDRGVSLNAKSILEQSNTMISSFLKGYKKYTKEDLAKLLRMALISLLMCANEQNRLESSSPKPSLQYFHDFLFFLHEILIHPDYHNLINNPPEKPDHFAHKVIDLIHALCYFYYHATPEKQRTERFISDILHEENKSKGNLWAHMLDQYDKMKDILKHLPSGPLLRAIDFFKEAKEDHAFNPHFLQNYPEKVFDLFTHKSKMTCLKLPSPTHQNYIQKAQITPEFIGALSHMSMQKKKSQLLIFNLQDRTSWKEFARCDKLEQLQFDARYKDVLTVVTFPKYTDFYRQTGDYLESQSAKRFMKSVVQHIESFESCGFYFPKNIDPPKLQRFAKKIVPWIHEMFFHKNENLSRQNRLDFIEIFYQFLFLKILEIVSPTEFSFTCKDWVDVGSSQSASFFAFIHLFHKFDQNELEEDLKNICFIPSLFIRERLIDEGRFHRMVSFLSCMQSEINKNPEILSSVEEHFKKFPIEKMEIKKT